MKKQINSFVKPHLLRSALILLSLVTFNEDIFCQATATPSPTPSPTASVCPLPTPGTCVSYEAESDDNTLEGSAFVLSCPTCSNGFKVGYVGNNSGTLQFPVGNVAPGPHSMTICYTNGDPVRYARLSVNGNQGIPLTFPSTGSFQTVGSIQTTVVLNTGCNTLEFDNPIVGSWAPDFDEIQFNCPACTSPPIPITCTPFMATGSIAGSDPTQTGRPLSSFVPQTCPPSSTRCQFSGTTPLHYDAYRFTNTTGSTQCVTIDTNTPCNAIFTAAYLGTFDPANICANWIGDSGSSTVPEQAFHVQVPAGQTLIVVVSEVVAGEGCLSYTLTINANCQSPGPTPTPRPTATPSAGPGARDFNRDGFPDYLLFNPSSLASVIWYLHNNVHVGSDHGPALPAGWNVAGVADFNGDGFPDLVLFNTNTRATRIWYLRNNDRIGTAVGPTLPGGWSLVGVADFNRDGHPDYLLFNRGSLATVVWYMNRDVHIASDHGPDLPMGWNVAGLADFNGDGFADLVLFSPNTGATRVWYLRNNDRIGTAAGPSIPAGSILAGVADFNRNGHPDYLLFNSTTRGTVIWYMNNNVHAGSAAAPTLPSGWTLVAP